MPKDFSKTGADAPVSPPAPVPGEVAPSSPVRARRTIRAKQLGGRKAARRKSNDAPPVLTHLPDRIIVLGDKVLPNLVQQPLVPGAGGTRKLKDGTWDFAGLRDDDEQRGGIFLDPSKLGYIEEDDNGELYPIWSNQAEYVLFVESLIEGGEIPAPSVDEVEHWLDQQTTLRDKINSEQKNPGAYTPEIERQIAVAAKWLDARRAA